MFKLGIVMVIITAAALYFIKEATVILQFLGHIQRWTILEVYKFFPHSHLIKLIIDIISIVALSFLLSLIPAFIYWFAKREELPLLKQIVLFIWLILLLVFIL